MRTGAGPPDADGDRRPRAIAGGERSGQDRRRNTFDERWHYLLD
jgi:hypothetical protein